MQIKKVGVLGCGLMGSGIAQVCAQSGYETLVREISPEFLQKGLDGIRKFASKMAERGQLKISVDDLFKNLRGTTQLEDMSDRDIIIEAVPEMLDLKKSTYKTLSEVYVGISSYGPGADARGGGHPERVADAVRHSSALLLPAEPVGRRRPARCAHGGRARLHRVLTARPGAADDEISERRSCIVARSSGRIVPPEHAQRTQSSQRPGVEPDRTTTPPVAGADGHCMGAAAARGDQRPHRRKSLDASRRMPRRA